MQNSIFKNVIALYLVQFGAARDGADMPRWWQVVVLVVVSGSVYHSSNYFIQLVTTYASYQLTI